MALIDGNGALPTGLSTTDDQSKGGLFGSTGDVNVNTGAFQGPTGPTGGAGETGPIGPAGPDGPIGEMGPTGLTGERGEAGPSGSTGETGSDGIQGPRGLTGPTGAASTEAGPAGSTGPAGPDGPAGPIGPIGVQGNIGPSGPAGADSNVRGPAGAQGEMGLTGPAGPTGPDGPTGSIGLTGPAGVTGDRGPIGNTGPDGEKGDDGNVGAQGITGLTGPAGPTGPDGEKGDDGTAGAQGNIGLTGPTGPDGATGPAGPIGVTGNVGPAGPTGIGIQGPAGPGGAAGAPGLTGETGPDGEKGDTGDTGAMGTTGLTGPAGPASPVLVNGPGGIDQSLGRVAIGDDGTDLVFSESDGSELLTFRDHTIDRVLSDGVEILQSVTTLNFTGSGKSLSTNVNSQPTTVNIDIPALEGIQPGHVILDLAGDPLTQEPNLRFTGSGVTAVSNFGDVTTVTVEGSDTTVMFDDGVGTGTGTTVLTDIVFPDLNTIRLQNADGSLSRDIDITDNNDIVQFNQEGTAVDDTLTTITFADDDSTLTFSDGTNTRVFTGGTATLFNQAGTAVDDELASITFSVDDSTLSFSDGVNPPRVFTGGTVDQSNTITQYVVGGTYALGDVAYDVDSEGRLMIIEATGGTTNAPSNPVAGPFRVVLDEVVIPQWSPTLEYEPDYVVQFNNDDTGTNPNTRLYRQRAAVDIGPSDDNPTVDTTNWEQITYNTFADLRDVNISDVQDSDELTFDAASGMWINGQRGDTVVELLDPDSTLTPPATLGNVSAFLFAGTGFDDVEATGGLATITIAKENRVRNITATPPAGDGSITYTATLVADDDTRTVDTIDWTTGATSTPHARLNTNFVLSPTEVDEGRATATVVTGTASASISSPQTGDTVHEVAIVSATTTLAGRAILTSNNTIQFSILTTDMPQTVTVTGTFTVDATIDGVRATTTHPINASLRIAPTWAAGVTTLANRPTLFTDLALQGVFQVGDLVQLTGITDGIIYVWVPTTNVSTVEFTTRNPNIGIDATNLGIISGDHTLFDLGALIVNTLTIRIGSV